MFVTLLSLVCLCLLYGFSNDSGFSTYLNDSYFIALQFTKLQLMLTQIVADYFVRSFMYFLSLIGPQEISRTTI